MDGVDSWFGFCEHSCHSLEGADSGFGFCEHSCHSLDVVDSGFDLCEQKLLNILNTCPWILYHEHIRTSIVLIEDDHLDSRVEAVLTFVWIPIHV